MIRYCVLLCAVFTFLCAGAQRSVVSVNDSWKFHKGDVSGIPGSGSSDHGWSLVSIPHTWNAQDAAGEEKDYFRGAGWYTKTIDLEPTRLNGKVYLYFEGANQVTELYVNGKPAGRHEGGYTRFNFDITSLVKAGSNDFAIRVDNSHHPDIPPLSADFTFFGGIYRDLYLVTMPRTHISTSHYSSNGVYITTPDVSADAAEVNIRVLVDNVADAAVVKVKNVIVSPAGKEVSSTVSDLKLAKSSGGEVVQKITLKNPALWDTESPNLYKVYTSLLDKHGKELDLVVNPLGVRWFSFDPEKGFFLNGRHLKLMGTNRHQDYSGKGNALRDEMHVRDVMLLKNMGGNFLRIAHYPQDPTILQLCDRLGIVTSVEIPIVNAVTDSEGFERNCVEMAREMVCQDFNSPSVIIWAYMNEVMLRPTYNREDKDAEQAYFAAVERIATGVENAIRTIDPYRYTMLPCHSSPDTYEKAGIAKLPMILGWNCYAGWYGGVFGNFDQQIDAIHERFPRQSHIITEYGADVDIRLHSFEPERFDYTAEYGNLYHEHYLKAIMERDYIAGANIWNLNDFYSKARAGAMPHVNMKGITGLDRELKDTYLLYKARFNLSPMVSIGGRSWKVRGGIVGGEYACRQPVKVYSNGAKVELMHNGKSLGVQDVVDHIAKFEVPFSNGENRLLAVAEIDGTKVTDQVDVDFRMVAQDLRDTKLPFTELNMMLGSKRYFEDRDAAIVWLPEREYSPGSWGYVGGEPVKAKTRFGPLPSADLDILGTEQDPVFQTQRKNIEALKFDVPDGEYAVYLYFAELVSGKEREALVYNLGNDVIAEKASQRSFAIEINGREISGNIDLAAQFGEERAVIIKYIVPVRNSEGLNVNFRKIAGEPVVNAVRLFKML